MLTAFVLTSVVAGGLPVMLAPQPFRALLDLRYPARAGGSDRDSRAVHDGFDAAPVTRLPRPEGVRRRARRRTVQADGNGSRATQQPRALAAEAAGARLRRDRAKHGLSSKRPRYCW